jgi:signal transduction histidine kinase
MLRGGRKDVPQSRLGLFDTPPDRREIRIGLALVGLLFAALAMLSAIPDARLRQIDAFIPMVDSIMFLGDAMTATLLYVQAIVFRSRALTVLASGYVVTALLLVAHALTFPGAFAPDGLLGAGLSTTGWIGIAWRLTLPTAIMFYAFHKRSERPAPPGSDRSALVATGILTSIAVAAAVVLLTTRGHNLLPSMYVGRAELNHGNFLIANFAMIGFPILALAVLFYKRTSVLDMWLLVALSGSLAAALLNGQATARFTVVFYSQFSLLLFSHFVVVLALVAESSRLYARLVLTTSARDRERDNRLMSMDAVAAAISHEVGQPLAGTMLNARSALHYLKLERPDVENAIKAQQGTLEAGQRIFEVIKNIRAMFDKDPDATTEFNLNDVVQETALMVDRELAGAKVRLQLVLDDELHPILGNRVLIQRILLNLLTNAIESVAAARGGSRRITIRTEQHDKDVRLVVSDSGTGVVADEPEHIFDALFSTKSAGAGLGLTLCRAIVEELGGRLWVAEGEKHGAAFHMQLPSGGLPAQH